MATEAVYVDTGKVRGRRKVRYTSFQDVVADAHRLNSNSHRQLGNWSLPMILQHLANGINGSIEGGGFRVKWYYKLIGPIIIKRMLIKGPFPAGFRLPRSAAARLVAQPTVTFEDGMSEFEKSIGRLHRETNRGVHPVAGRLSIPEWDQFHLRHAEMHMSFLIFDEDPGLA